MKVFGAQALVVNTLMTDSIQERTSIVLDIVRIRWVPMK